MNVAALYVRSDTIYRSIPGVGCWDRERDARLYAGSYPVVSHPPCGPWGNMRIWRRYLHEKIGWGSSEYDSDGAAMGCGPIAVHQVRRFGGVLEHLAGSALWRHMGMPGPGDRNDSYEGYTIEIEQSDFGHRARKRTWLYIVGYPTGALGIELPEPVRSESVAVVEMMGRKEREETPERLARWLVWLAGQCHRYGRWRTHERGV